MENKVILSGIQPSGIPTLANYVGALRNWKLLQNGNDCYYCVANMHALTVRQNPDELRERSLSMATLIIAFGIDPVKSPLFIQSDVHQHAELAWVLDCNTYMGELNRMTQFKDKSKKNANFSAGLFTYPVLMAADILLYDSDYVPVGVDQKQHVELARNIAERFNKNYGETFVVPEPLIPKVGAKIMDLSDPTRKMSKSDVTGKGVIYLLDDEKTIRKKIMSAVTDSESKVYYDLVNKPGISNLLTIYSSLKEISIKETEEHFKDYNYGNLKKEVADLVVEKLSIIQEKYNNLINSEELDKILDNGKDITNVIAKKKLEEVFNKVGLGRY